MRLRFLRPGAVFRILIEAEQLEKIKRVVLHNGGAILVSSSDAEGITLTIGRGDPQSD